MLVSIIVPTLNSASYLEQALCSCLEQDYSNIEIVVVDGGSADGTLEIVEKIASQRVRCIHQPGNSGKLPGALDLGFSNAVGEYLTWISSDNYLAPNAISKLAGYLTVHPRVDFVYSDYWLVGSDGKVAKRVEVGPPEDIWHDNVVQQSFLFRRSVYERVGHHRIETFPVQDYDYWLRVAKCCKLARLQEPLQYYRVHSGSLTAQYTDLGLARGMAMVRLNQGVYGWRAYRHELSRIDMAAAFQAHLQHDSRGVVCYTAKALANDLGWLANRGVYSICLRALLGRDVLRKVKSPRGAG